MIARSIVAITALIAVAPLAAQSGTTKTDPAHVAADASSAPVPAVSTTLSDSEAAAAFDAEHGGLEAALRAGVLPRRYFQRDMPPPSRPQGPTIRQLIPAGRTDILAGFRSVRA